MAKDPKTPRVQRTIRSNVAEAEALIVVKKSIYPWDDLIPQKGDSPSAPARNFFVECGSRDEAKTMRSSINSSGLNYYLKRKLGLIPVVVASRIGEGEDETFGVFCTVVADDS